MKIFGVGLWIHWIIGIADLVRNSPSEASAFDFNNLTQFSIIR